MYLYLALEFICIIIPLIYSFDKKLRFYRKWKSVLSSIAISGTFFLAFDIVFTKIGIWGFNAKYHSGITIFQLPLEEWLFFIVVPYSCLFLHHAFVFLFRRAMLSVFWVKTLSVSTISVSALIIIFNYQKAYTLYAFLLVLLILIASLGYAKNILKSYYITFMIMLIPFFLINTILTGGLIDKEVVWYNNKENLDIRLLTVPVEDIAYAFSLVLLTLLLMHRAEKFFPIKEDKTEKI